MGLFDLDQEKLKQESDDVSNSKMWLNVANSAANGLLSAPSAAEIRLGTKRAPVNVGLDKVADSLQDPWDKQKKTYEAYKAAKEGKDLESDMNPDSKSNKAMDALLIGKYKADPAQLQGLTRSQKMELFGNPGKLAEIEAQSQISFNNDMEKQKALQGYQSREKQLDRQADLNKIIAEKSAGAKLPSTEATNLAKSSDALKDVMAFRDSTTVTEDFSPYGKLNPFRYTPESKDNTRIKTYENQAKAMMQKIGSYLEGGKLTDADFDSKYLPMAPRFDDTKELKTSKMDNLEKMVKQRMNSELDSYGKAGYNVKNFDQADQIPQNPLAGKSESKTAMQDPLMSPANAGGKKAIKKLFNSKMNKTEFTYEDGSKETLDGRQ